MDNIPLLRRRKAEIYHEGSWQFGFPGKTGPTFLLYCGYLTISFSFFLMLVFFFCFNLKIEAICHLSKRFKQYKFQVKDSKCLTAFALAYSSRSRSQQPATASRTSFQTRFVNTRVFVSVCVCTHGRMLFVLNIPLESYL